MYFELPPLPPSWSSWTDLDPILTAEQVQAHYLLHHVGYVERLNEAVAQLDFEPPNLGWLLQNLSSISNPELQEVIKVNGGGHYNHTMYWTSLVAPGLTRSIPPLLGEFVGETFGTLDLLDSTFIQNAQDLTGSGYVWLVLTPDDTVEIQTTQNQDNPLTLNSGVPLCNVDVWEHAYYLDYIADRPAYLRQLLGCLNLSKVEARLHRFL